MRSSAQRETSRESSRILAVFARTRLFGDSSIEYEVFFFIDDFAQAPRIEAAVRDRIYYALARKKLEIPFPTRALVLMPPVETAESGSAGSDRRAATLANLDVVGPLPDEARRVLGRRATVRLYGPEKRSSAKESRAWSSSSWSAGRSRSRSLATAAVATGT